MLFLLERSDNIHILIGISKCFLVDFFGNPTKPLDYCCCYGSIAVAAAVASLKKSWVLKTSPRIGIIVVFSPNGYDKHKVHAGLNCT